METRALLIAFLCTGLATASTLEKLSSSVFNMTRGRLENIVRPLMTTLSRTQDTFRGSLRADDGKTALNIFGTTGGRLPYNVFGSAENGARMDFVGRIVSSIRPYLEPLRIITSKSSGNASAHAWSTSEEQSSR